jgi:HAE1 family hydrophobic/amphiphilic exporter-1
MDLEVRFDSTLFIEDAVNEVKFTLLLAVILTAFICWIFLGSWSSTLNILLAIPTSIVGTFAVMYFAGFTLNLMTLLALSLAVGIVVDDAIMVMENIVRHAERGEPRRVAASEGTREITGAAIAATAAILAIFLPVAFMRDEIGRFFFQFGVTLSVAVFISLAEALTIAPARCSQFIAIGERSSALGRLMDRLFGWLSRVYEVSLRWSLRWRGAVLAVAALGFLASLRLAGSLKAELIPSQDQSRIPIRIETPLGSSIAVTDEGFSRVEAFLRSRPEVSSIFGFVGGFSGSEVNVANVFTTLVPANRRALSQQQFMDEIGRAHV